MAQQYLNKHDARNVSDKLSGVIKGKRKVAIDVRVSTQHEQQINALDNQKQWAVELANDHEDWIFNEDKDLFVEEGLSGTSLAKRPQFTEMIERAKAGEYDLIVVREVCRFMRNAKLTLVLVDELLECDVEVFFVNDSIWTRNTDDYFKLTIMAQYAEQESRKVSERVFSGQAIARENGVLFGNGNILGYDLIKGKKSKETTYIINEEQAKTVRLIYELALKGYGVKKIKRYLQDNGYKTATGTLKWYESTIERILRRTTYMGELKYFQSVTENPLTHQRVKVSKDKQMLIPVQIPQIIESELWYRVQEAIDSRINRDWVKGDKTTGINGKVESKDIYCRKMRCGCGRKFKKDYDSSNGTATYRCYQLVDDGSLEVRTKRSKILDDNCSIYGIRDWKMDMFTLNVFRYLDCNLEEVRKKLLCVISKAYVASTDKGYSEDDLLKIDKEIEKLKKKNEILLDGFEDGILDKQTYQDRKGKNDKEISKKIELQKKFQALKFNDDKKQRTLKTVEKFVDDILKFPSIDDRRLNVPDVLIETYVNSIKVCGNNVIEYNIRVNPDVKIDIPVIPDEEFNPQIHSAKKMLDNSESSLIAEFEIDYDEAKEYANNIQRKVKRVHFDKPVVIKIFADLYDA